MPDDIHNYNLNEFFLQIESESKLIIQNLKNMEKIYTIIENLS